MFTGREEILGEMLLLVQHGASGNEDLLKRVLKAAADYDAAGAEQFYINESALEQFKIRNSNVKRMVVEEVNMLVDVMLSIIDEMII